MSIINYNFRTVKTPKKYYYFSLVKCENCGNEREMSRSHAKSKDIHLCNICSKKDLSKFGNRLTKKDYISLGDKNNLIFQK